MSHLTGANPTLLAQVKSLAGDERETQVRSPAPQPSHPVLQVGSSPLLGFSRPTEAPVAEGEADTDRMTGCCLLRASPACSASFRNTPPAATWRGLPVCRRSPHRASWACSHAEGQVLKGAELQPLSPRALSDVRTPVQEHSQRHKALSCCGIPSHS